MNSGHSGKPWSICGRGRASFGSSGASWTEFGQDSSVSHGFDRIRSELLAEIRSNSSEFGQCLREIGQFRAMLDDAGGIRLSLRRFPSISGEFGRFCGAFGTFRATLANSEANSIDVGSAALGSGSAALLVPGLSDGASSAEPRRHSEARENAKRGNAFRRFAGLHIDPRTDADVRGSPARLSARCPWQPRFRKSSERRSNGPRSDAAVAA